MSKYLKRYIFLFQQLKTDELDDNIRCDYEDEIDSIYYELDGDDLAYLIEKDIEM